jgi:hypothetical protein
MGRGSCTFRQKDVARLLKAARAAGEDVARVEIDKDGRISLIMGKPTETTPVNPWDAMKDKWRGGSGPDEV